MRFGAPPTLHSTFAGETPAHNQNGKKQHNNISRKEVERRVRQESRERRSQSKQLDTWDIKKGD